MARIRPSDARPLRPTTEAGPTEASATTSTTRGADAPLDAMATPTITDAEVRPEFRISVRGVSGAKTPKPALMDDWFNAAVDAEARHLAHQEVGALVHNAVSAEMNKLGRELDDDEYEVIAKPIEDTHLRPAYAKHYAVVSKDDTSQKNAVNDAIVRRGPDLAARARDPFTPIAQNVPGARDNEVVLYENKNAMIIIDTFARSPKALVIPKEKAMFPGDLKPAVMDQLAELSQLVSDALVNVTGSKVADIWINPPQRLTVKQLHVHVQPHLPRWESERRPRGVPPAPELVAEQQKFYAALTKEIGALLNAPATTSPMGTRG